MKDLKANGKKKTTSRFVASPQMDLFSSSFLLLPCNENIDCIDCRQCVAAETVRLRGGAL